MRLFRLFKITKILRTIRIIKARKVHHCIFADSLKPPWFLLLGPVDISCQPSHSLLFCFFALVCRCLLYEDGRDRVLHCSTHWRISVSRYMYYTVLHVCNIQQYDLVDMEYACPQDTYQWILWSHKGCLLLDLALVVLRTKLLCLNVCAWMYLSLGTLRLLCLNSCAGCA